MFSPKCIRCRFFEDSREPSQVFYKILVILIFDIIIKFPYNGHSDWLKQRALSENRERVDDIKPAFKFLFRNFDQFDPN